MMNVQLIEDPDRRGRYLLLVMVNGIERITPWRNARAFMGDDAFISFSRTATAHWMDHYLRLSCDS